MSSDVDADFARIRALWAIDELCGFSDERIAEFQTRWGQVPAVLWRYYAEFGAHRGMNHSQDNLVAPDTPPGWIRSSGYQDVYWENQGVFTCAIRSDQAQLDDPPVWVTHDEKEWLLESAALSDFLVAMAFYQAGFGLPYSGRYLALLTSAETKMLRQRFPLQCVPLLLGTWKVEVRGIQPDDAIVLLNTEDCGEGDGDGIQFCYASGSPDHFAELDAALKDVGEPL
jgi:hypothetical protein